MLHLVVLRDRLTVLSHKLRRGATLKPLCVVIIAGRAIIEVMWLHGVSGLWGYVVVNGIRVNRMA